MNLKRRRARKARKAENENNALRRGDPMRRLGKVLHVSGRGSIILRTEKTPPMGKDSRVLDKKAQDIGFISDVFGPVKTPYVSIKPKKGVDPAKLVGQMLYLQKSR